MKNLLASVLLLVGLTAVSGCKKDDTTTTSNTMTVSGDLSGANQVPAVSTPATGNFTGTFDKGTKVLNYTITYSGLTGPATAGHFHIAPPGQANPMFTLAFKSLSSPITGTDALTPDQESALMAGNLYANIHTDKNKGGEIRANLVAK